MRTEICLIAVFLLFYGRTQAEEIMDDTAYINSLGSRIDVCRQQFIDNQRKKEKLTPSVKRDYLEMQNDYDVQQCYNSIAKEVFAYFYPDNQEVMLNNLKSLEKATYEYYADVYSKGKYCDSNCGLLSLVYANRRVTYELQQHLIAMLEYLYKQSTNHFNTQDDAL